MVEIKGSFAKGREQMKVLRAEKVKELRKLSKGINSSKVNELKAQIPIYSVSLTIPAEIKGIVVNGKLLQTFMKKINNMPHEFFFYKDKLRIQYGKYYGEFTGSLELKDLSNYFEGFT